jgi:hypothetical protein
MTSPSANGTAFPATVPAAARWYADRGFGPIRLRPRSKAFYQSGGPPLPDDPAKFAEADNIGLVNGAPGGNLIDIDLDSHEAIRAADLLLPQTHAIYGRLSARASHRLYRTDAPPEKASDPFVDPTLEPHSPDRLLLELRSTGGESMCPPSAHPGGELVEWDTCGEPATVPIAELARAVRETAAAALIGRYWPTSARHFAALALAGGLLRAGLTTARAETFIRAVCAVAGDDEVQNRVACVADTEKRFKDDKKANGWPKLAELLGQRGNAVITAIRGWIDTEPRPTMGGTAPAPPTPEPIWPDRPNAAAFPGLAGDIVRAIEPASEADPVALLVQTLVYCGNAIGRGPYFPVEADRHYTNEFVVLVGPTAKGRKGISRSRIHALFAAAEAMVDPDAVRAAGEATWARDRVQSGLSSGEGLIWAVRDPHCKPERVKERGEPVRYETVEVDPGEPDKRLLVYEPEFANVLKQIERQGNTLSAVIRQAWETGTLRALTKNTPARATGAHISLIGHITAEELTRYLSATESANGFGNRFMWFVVKRSKLLPEGGRVDEQDMDDLAGRIADAVRHAAGVGEMTRDPEARDLWCSVYGELSGDRPGLAGCLLGRAEAHVLRLSMLYALLDQKAVIGAEHLLAALALWDHAEKSVHYVFGDALGDPLADELLLLIRAAGDRGITKNEIVNYTGRHTSAEQRNRALNLLRHYRLAHPRSEPTGGRPAERWFAGPGE